MAITFKGMAFTVFIIGGAVALCDTDDAEQKKVTRKKKTRFLI